MKYLIVNADDFGASPGITRGILEAHADGILTSTSMMVDTPWSAEAASLAGSAPRLKRTGREAGSTFRCSFVRHYGLVRPRCR